MKRLLQLSEDFQGEHFTDVTTVTAKEICAAAFLSGFDRCPGQIVVINEYPPIKVRHTY
jgi:hypothetical protein